MTVSFPDLNSPDLLTQLPSGNDATSIRSQCVVVEVQQQQLALPSGWVDEVLLFPRQQIIRLPFYQKPVVGVIPHHGRLVLLVEYPCEGTSDAAFAANQDYIRALQLSGQVGDLAGVAIQIDRIIGTIPQADLEVQTVIQLFESDKISLQSFQPYRWI